MSRQYPPHATPERYLQALGDHDPIDSMRKAPKRLRKLLRGASNKELRRATAEGKWSVHQVLAHLVDSDAMLGARVRFIAGMERPPIIGYDQDSLVANLKSEELDTETLWREFAALRAINVALFERLPDEALARVGVHSERGDESIVTMLFMYAGHDRIHETQIGAVLDGLRKSKSEAKARSKSESKGKKKDARKRAKKS